MQEPAFRSRFEDGVLLILEEVDSAGSKKYDTDGQKNRDIDCNFRSEGGVTLDEFLKSFSK